LHDAPRECSSRHTGFFSELAFYCLILDINAIVCTLHFSGVKYVGKEGQHATGAVSDVAARESGSGGEISVVYAHA